MRSAWMILVMMLVTLGTALPTPAQQSGRPLKERFLDHATAELALSSDQRDRLDELFDRAMERRRDLVREQFQLRRQISEALSDPSTPDLEFTRLSARIAELKQAEADLIEWQRNELSTILRPRQALRFFLLQQRLAERIQDARRRGGTSR